MAEEAIRRWVWDLQLDQKVLASEVGVSQGTVSHIINDPHHAIGEELAQRIVRVVEKEARTRARVNALPMEIVAPCHDLTDVLYQVEC